MIGVFLSIDKVSKGTYICYMTVEQTVEIPADHRLIIKVPHEVPAGRTILTFTPVPAASMSGLEHNDQVRIPKSNPRTVTEALRMAAERAADPNRKSISRHFGKHKGIFGGDGLAYQRAVRDEWD